MSQPIQEQQPPRRRSPSPASRHYVPIVFTRDDFPNVYRPISHRHDPPTPPALPGAGDYRHVPLSSRMAPGGTTPAPSLDAIKASPMTNSSPTLLSRIRTPPQREQRDRDRNNIHISNNNSNTRLPPRPGFALPAARMEHPLPERPRATWNDTFEYVSEGGTRHVSSSSSSSSPSSLKLARLRLLPTLLRLGLQPLQQP
ncbi:hypothetical protein M378DRAFT_10825 [Amanita muscaria Koide BX008]|uniref:Uncharacterized protein n=1 Tax=Amanita muscaria (strain Koide BX008) TaxID=946122 RepID=A0A0C2X9H5_AMAMK|nr:hypothetical protein M378DRAFT_10825 [Amanita muscaria Koide BX008]